MIEALYLLGLTLSRVSVSKMNLTFSLGMIRSPLTRSRPFPSKTLSNTEAQLGSICPTKVIATPSVAFSCFLKEEYFY